MSVNYPLVDTAAASAPLAARRTVGTEVVEVHPDEAARASRAR